MKKLLMKIKRKLCRHNFVPDYYFKSTVYNRMLGCSDRCSKCGIEQLSYVEVEREQELKRKGYTKNLCIPIWQSYVKKALDCKKYAFPKRSKPDE